MKERIYTIPIRQKLLKKPRWERSKEAMGLIRNFLKRHMKSDKIKIDKSIGEEIWKGGGQKLPGKIKIRVVKDDEGTVTAELWKEITG